MQPIDFGRDSIARLVLKFQSLGVTKFTIEGNRSNASKSSLVVVGRIAFNLLSSGRFAAQISVPVTLVKASRLLDPRTGHVLSPATVLIEEGDQGGWFAFSTATYAGSETRIV